MSPELTYFYRAGTYLIPTAELSANGVALDAGVHYETGDKAKLNLELL